MIVSIDEKIMDTNSNCINNTIDISSNSSVSKQMAYRQWPGTSHYPVIALHGWLDNLESFTPLMNSKVMQSSGLSVTAIDFAGHGESFTRPSGENLHFIDNVADILAFAEAMGWEKFFILGHSMGAALGSLVAATYPEKVVAFVSLEALGPIAGEASEAVIQLKKHLKSRLKSPGKIPHYETFKAALEARMEKGGAGRNAMKAMVKRNLIELDGVFSWKTDQRLRQPTAIRMTQQHSRVFLKNIRCPTLAIWGDNGFKKLYPEVSERGVNIDLIKQIELAGGHHLHMEHPEQVAEKVEAFFKRCLKAIGD